MSTIIDYPGLTADKGGFPHYMLKEIHEQPVALRNTLEGRIDPGGRRVTLDELGLDPAAIRNINRIFITACGTAYHAGLTGKYLLERLARIPVEIDVASEFCYRDPLLGPGDVVIVVSQSGETADTLAAMAEARRRGARIIAITNVVGSTVARKADHVLYTWAGPEIAVASTKAYTAQLAAFYLLAVWLGAERGALSEAEQAVLLRGLRELDAVINPILDNATGLTRLAKHYASSNNIFFLGRNLDYPSALEGNLKLKETSYVHAEAFPAGELRHGPLALITDGVPVIILATQPQLFERTRRCICEVRERGGRAIAITFRGQTGLEDLEDHAVYLPSVHPLLAPILSVIPLQLFAYHTAVSRGCPIDNPRGLTKAVTTE